ncbi:MAG TPA: hypothetical protein VK982_13270 [Bacteroidales bacterium]|nr:hypothetical protein [Bacteroidales bacterium]
MERIDELYDALEEIKWICEGAPRVHVEDSEQAHEVDEAMDDILDEVNRVLK